MKRGWPVDPSAPRILPSMRFFSRAELDLREQIHARHAVSQERQRIREAINAHYDQLQKDGTSNGNGQRLALEWVRAVLDVSQTIVHPLPDHERQ